MNEAHRILIVDDDSAQAEMVAEFLRISGYSQIDWAANIRAFWEYLDRCEYDIVLLDYKLPDGTGLDVLEQMESQGYRIPVVMVTGQGNERVAVQAIQHGAADYLLKSGDYLITLPSLIHKTVNAHQLQLSIERSLEQIRYQATLLDNVRDAIVVWDLEGRITYWNPAAQSLFGWGDTERLGRPVAQVYLKAFTPTIKQPRESGTSDRHIERQCRHRAGGTIWVSSRVTTLTDAEGRSIGYMDICHDITARVQAEQALRESEARYRAIVEDYQTELICRFQQDGRLTFVNEVFCRYFGEPREALLGKNLMDFIPKAERRKMKNHLSTFSPEIPTLTIEHQIILPDQKLRWLQRTDRAILNDEGHIVEFQSVGRDITDRKEMESQIQAVQASLVQAARMATIGEMASGVAHQIYNPLTTIIADAQILLRKLPAKQPGRDSAEAIEQAGWRLQQVVQRLMDFSRPATDTLVSLSVNETIRRALSLVGTQIESIGCRLKVHLSDELPPVRGNPRQLEDLWVNLLLLARDASSNGSSHHIRVNSQPGPANTVIVEVCDDGRPIPAENLHTIFEPDFVGPAGTRGTGLELSICREIVRQHQGEIVAESAPGRDTIFRVTLPAEKRSGRNG
jgi:PAS domain S-box-containing protein